MPNRFFSHIMLHARMFWIKLAIWQPLMRQTFSPQRTQEKLLLRILDKNKHTEFGQLHGFAAIKDYREFQRAVPVHTYEELRGAIERQEISQKPCLNAEQPAMYAQTSGTTGNPKFIPILPQTIVQYRRSQFCVAYAIHAAIPQAYAGKVLAIVSPAVEGHMASGTPYGSMSGLIQQSMPDFVAANYVLPSTLFDISDYELKYHLITVFALAEKHITLIATANPSTLLKISAIINSRLEALIAEIAAGNTYGLRANPQRAAELESLVREKPFLTFANIWPNLQAVSTWTSGNCALLLPALRKQLKKTTRIVEMGYLSSEFRGTITVDALENKGMPTIHENFFEFVERDRWEDRSGEFLTIASLQSGKQYYVFVTTQTGLYRYFINDIIEVDGCINRTPCIHFVQKGKGVINLTGEKLYESQVIEAIRRMKQELNVNIEFFMMLGNPESLQYHLYLATDPVAHVTATFEKHLCALNIEFAAKRQSGRLQETTVYFVSPMVAEAYKKHCITRGQREGQFKLMKLQTVQDCTFDFSPYRVRAHAA